MFQLGEIDTKQNLQYLNWSKLTLSILNQDVSYFENSVGPDQLASSEASWSRSTMFVRMCWYLARIL